MLYQKIWCLNSEEFELDGDSTSFAIEGLWFILSPSYKFETVYIQHKLNAKGLI